jgi:hypothetical protein
VSYTVLWRFFLSYVTIFVGGTILFRWLEADGQRLLADPSGDSPNREYE